MCVIFFQVLSWENMSRIAACMPPVACIVYLGGASEVPGLVVAAVLLDVTLGGLLLTALTVALTAALTAA
jgi:hypothetical protein